MKGLLQKWKRQKLAEQGLSSLGIGLLLGSLAVLFLNLPNSILPWAILGSGLLSFPLLLWYSGYFSTQLSDLAHFLNQNYPELEQSSDLLLQDEKALSGLAQLQRERVNDNLQQLKIKLPNHWQRAFLILILGGLSNWGLQHFSFPAKGAIPIATGQNLGKNGTALNDVQSDLPPKLLRGKITIAPPGYTKLPIKTSNLSDIEAPFRSKITWTLSFDQPLQEAQLVMGDGSFLALRQNSNGQYTTRTTIQKATFYQVKFRTNSSDWQLSDYYQINVIEDQPPEIQVTGLPVYAEYLFNPDKTISFQVSLQDDYGIADAYIVATLSKGEGESVKFRDDTLTFEAAFKTQRQLYTLSQTLRLGDLNMEAGDELYLHIEAKDNQSPTPQTSKTYKYILAFEDPDQMEVDMAGGLAVNRMPEYFRSQRQIIIDTEKLIAKRSKMKPVAFNEESNNIAIDQKLLRLRYGRFLGEEFETVIGADAGEAHDEHEHDHGISNNEQGMSNIEEPQSLEVRSGEDEHGILNIEQGMSNIEGPRWAKEDPHGEHEHHHDHDHDHGHEHGISNTEQGMSNNGEPQSLEVKSREHEHEHGNSKIEGLQDQKTKTSEDQYLGGGHDHEHEHGNEKPQKEEFRSVEDASKEVEELEPYVHAHDIAEEVTYFDATTSAKLRAALAQMWDAELHLRMGNPEKALPHEYTALKLIKEIQQASRIYVERIGFDPPVIKVAEKRLTGELKKIRSSMVETEQSSEVPFAALRKSIPILESLKQVNRPISKPEKAILEAAGDELAALALEQPGRFLISLQKLRDVIDQQVAPLTREAYLEDLQKIGWEVLSNEAFPVQEEVFEGDLKTLFLQELLRTD